MLTENNNIKKVKIMPIGGLEQIGMNITLFEYEDDIIIVDCGIAFPDEEMFGIDLVIPDIGYLKSISSRIKGIFFTHGHEDHIGAIPFVLKEINVPIYGTKLTIGLIENKLKEHKILDLTERHVVSYGEVIKAGAFEVEYVRTNHSIPDPAALAISTEIGTIVHTGDFKVDYAPIYGEPIDLQRLGELGKKGVLLLMADSTNAGRDGYTQSESSVGKSFNELFGNFKGKRIIVATFASNVDRVQQIINAASIYNRKVIVEGRSMKNVVGLAIDLGYIKVPKNMLITFDEIENYKDGQIVIITTGSQGEPMAALSRMAYDNHRHISIHENDKIIFSSKPIPGNERSVNSVTNALYSKGAEVIIEDTHVSGHACREELKLIQTLLKPKFFMPIHGEVSHLIQHKDIALGLGMKESNIVILKPGDVTTVTRDSIAITDHIDTKPVYVDGISVGDVGNLVIRDRQKLSQDGIVTVILTISRDTKELLVQPEIVTRGFVLVKESYELIEESKRVIEEAVLNSKGFDFRDYGRMKNIIRRSLSDYLWKQTKRNPMILPVINIV